MNMYDFNFLLLFTLMNLAKANKIFGAHPHIDHCQKINLTQNNNNLDCKKKSYKG